MAQIRVEFTIPTSADIRRIEEVLLQELATSALEIVEGVADMARRNVKVDRGILRSSIGTEVSTTDSRITATVFTGRQAPHARHVEFGTRARRLTGAKPPPIGPLKGWARRVLGNENAAYAIRHKIVQRGTQPTLFMQNAIDIETRTARSVMEEGLSRAVRRLSSGQ